jgi:hypothetical protein
MTTLTRESLGGRDSIYREGEICAQVFEQVSWAVVQASRQDEPMPVPVPAVACDAAIDAPLAPGTTQVVWQLAALELHLIMQFVTVEVTVVVSGVTGCDCSCATAAPERMIDKNAVETADTIATRRMSDSPKLFRRHVS